MRKYLIAAALTAAFVSPALAEQFDVVFDPASHKCSRQCMKYPGHEVHGHLWQHGRSQEGDGA